MDDLPAVQSLWVGGELSKMEQTSINSFLNKGHDYHLYTYGHVKGVPKGVDVKEAGKIFPKTKYVEEKSKESATFSNKFRYKLLKNKGGIWVDADIICLRPFNFEKEYVFASERVERQSKWDFDLPARPVGCVIKSPKQSKIIDYCLQESEKFNSKRVEWGKIGTRLVGKAVEKFNMQEFVAPFWKFCPISWWNWRALISENKIEIFKEKIKKMTLRPYSYHLWNSMWSENGIDKDKEYSRETIYGGIQKEV